MECINLLLIYTGWVCLNLHNALMFIQKDDGNIIIGYIKMLWLMVRTRKIGGFRRVFEFIQYLHPILAQTVREVDNQKEYQTGWRPYYNTQKPLIEIIGIRYYVKTPLKSDAFRSNI
jgi:hypothetical protein